MSLSQLALSSDNVSILREGILMLKITTSNPNGVVEETLIEFNEKDTDSFLSLLIDASKVRTEIYSCLPRSPALLIIIGPITPHISFRLLEQFKVE